MTICLNINDDCKLESNECCCTFGRQDLGPFLRCTAIVAELAVSPLSATLADEKPLSKMTQAEIRETLAGM